MDKEARTIMVACKIFLVSLLIFSAGSEALDNVKNKEARKIFQEVEGVAFRRKKSLRSLGSENMNTPGNSLRPKTYKEESKKCPKGTYWHVSYCAECKKCRVNERMVKECTDKLDRKCTCVEGYFKDTELSSFPDDFNCKKCINCSLLHKQTLQECHENEDAKCGRCLVGFFASGQTCKPRPQPRARSTIGAPVSSAAPFRSSAFKSTGPTSSTIPKAEQCNVACKMVLGACGCFFFLGGALVLCYKKKAIAAQEKPLSALDLYTGESHSGSPVTSLPERAMLVDKAPSHHRSLQQGRKLYTIINAVPVRRWKEFVRGLGLQDSEIELVELEHTQFREQQYEMLKRWCQRRVASVDAVLATLEAMQLGGCAQELREQLQVEHSQGNP